MKKNKAMRLASCLLVLTLLTACMISGTFAKYVSGDTTSDTAKVAKWGVTAQASGSLFGKAYNSNTAVTDGDEIAATSTNVSGTDNVVAPCTKNTKGLILSISGTPEVANTVAAAVPKDKTNSDIFLKEGTYGVMAEANGVTAANVTDYYVESSGTYTKATNGSFNADTTYYKLVDEAAVVNDYYPINWKVTPKTGNAVENIKKGTELLTSIKTVFGSTSNNAGVALDNSCTITWEWPIGTDAANNDAADTILGHLMNTNSKVVKQDAGAVTYQAVADADYSTKLAFNVELSVTQID